MIDLPTFGMRILPQTAFGRGAPDLSWSTILIDLLDEVK